MYKKEDQFILIGKDKVLFKTKFKEIKIKTLKEYEKLKEDYDNGEWIFRGQSKYKYNLETNGERYFSFSTIDKEKKSYKGYTEYLKEKFPKELIKKFSEIQHYGGITNLLDFSSSMDIGLFFAVNRDIGYDGSLWILNKSFIEKLSTIVEKKSEVNLFYIQNDKNNIQNANKVLQNLVSNPSGIIFIDNLKVLFKNDYNLRMKNQEGCFIFHNDSKNSLMKCLIQKNPPKIKNLKIITGENEEVKNIKNMKYLLFEIFKIKIAKGCKIKLLKKLNKEGIDYNKLFPAREKTDKYGEVNQYLIDYLVRLNPKDSKNSEKKEK